jgi:hypothetical protein
MKNFSINIFWKSLEVKFLQYINTFYNPNDKKFEARSQEMCLKTKNFPNGWSKKSVQV